MAASSKMARAQMRTLGHRGAIRLPCQPSCIQQHRARRTAVNVMAKQAVLEPEYEAPAPAGTKPGTRVVDLPPLTKGKDGQGFPGLDEGAYTDKPRAAQALLFPPKNTTSRRVPAIIFAHGFSQGPENYASLIEQFNQEGWLVIAPTTNVSTVTWPWQGVETTGMFASLQEKLQSALVLDLLRSWQYIKEGQDEWQISKVMLCGHSMGGASALVLGSYLQGKEEVASVGIMAPAVKQTVQSKVNPLLHLDGVRSLSPVKYRASVAKFFQTTFPKNVDVHLVGANNDLIVPKQEVEDVYLGALAGRGEDGTGLEQPKELAYYSVPWGGHIGFEDSIDIDFNILGNFQKTLMLVLDFLIYQADFITLLFPSENFKKQKEVSRDLLVDLFTASLGGKPLVPQVHGIANVGGPFPDPKAPYSLTPVYSTAEMLTNELVEDPNKGIPALSTSLLLGYAAAHATACYYSTTTLWQTLWDNHWAFSRPELGLGITSIITAGLVWENLVLAAGRYITKNGTQNMDVLQNLNDPRFLFHSLAPLLSITGVDLASRAGVQWADGPAFTGPLSLVLSIVVSLSLVSNTLLLQTRPQWSRSILHFTYTPKPLDFTRIIPVAVTTAFLLALGIGADKHDPALWILPAGAGACLALSAGIVPRSVAPMVLTGNLGEVFLLTSMVAAEVMLK